MTDVYIIIVGFILFAVGMTLLDDSTEGSRSHWDVVKETLEDE